MNSTRVIITLFLMSVAHTAIAQQGIKYNPQEDSALISNKLEKLRNEAEEGDNTSFFNGVITYAPDSLFKILTIEGEACGAYCHSAFNTYIYTLPKGVATEANAKIPYLSAITDIIQIKDNKDSVEYLIFDKRHVRPRSVETGTEISFSHLVVTKNKLFFKPINTFSAEGTLFKEPSMYFYSSENLCLNGDENDMDKGIPPTLSYNPKTMTITYEYAKNNDDFSLPCKYITGTYHYKNGVFTNQ